MDNGMELRVKDYCAFCPDFEADVDKVDITVLADRTQRALTTIRCEHAEKCERIYGRLQEGRTNETTVVQSSVHASALVYQQFGRKKIKVKSAKKVKESE